GVGDGLGRVAQTLRAAQGPAAATGRGRRPARTLDWHRPALGGAPAGDYSHVSFAIGIRVPPAPTQGSSDEGLCSQRQLRSARTGGHRTSEEKRLTGRAAVAEECRNLWPAPQGLACAQT